MRSTNKLLASNTDKIIDTYTSILKEYIATINETKHSDNLITIMFIGMNAIHRVFEYILLKTKNIEKVCYYSKKTYYYYLEYMEQIYLSNLHHNLNQMDAILFVYKKTIFDLYNGENEDTFGTMTNIITSNGEIMIIDEAILQNILKKLSKTMNLFFYWENSKITFHERKELCNQYLEMFIKKCFLNNQIVVFMEVIQKRTSLKQSDYVILLKEIFELSEKKRRVICDADLNQRRIKMGHPRVSDVNFRGHNLEDAKRDVPFQIFDGLNDWSLNKFYIQKYEFEEFINDNNMKGLIKWVFD